MENIESYFDNFGEKRKARKEARKERVQQRQAAKTTRQANRQAARQTKATTRQEGRVARTAQRQEGKVARQGTRQAKRLDKVQLKRKALQNLDTTAANSGANNSAENIAENYLRTPEASGKVERYIENQGAEVPEGASPAELAYIASNLRDEEVQDTTEALNEGLEEGEEPYTEEEAEQFCFDGSEISSFDGDNFDNYDPVTAAAVSKAAAKGAELLKEKRQKQGKSTKFIEDVEKFLKPQTAESKEPTSDAGKIIDEGITEYKKQTIKGYMPYIIIAVILIILGTLWFKKK